MSVAPNSGIIDFSTFTPPTGGENGIQGQVPAPLIGQENYILSANGWIAGGGGGSGTVTSVSGTGSVSGITLSGTVTSSGSLTLGGALDLSSPPAIGNTTPSTGKFTSVTTPSVTATTNDLTLSSASTGVITLNTASTPNTFLTVKDDTTTPASQTGLTVLGASSGLGRLALRSNKALYVASGSSNNISFLTNSGAVSEGSTQMLVAHTASAVNYVQVTGAATTGTPVISAQGSDTNVGIAYNTKGTATHTFQTNGTTRMQINSGGQVNMGFTNGVAALQVNGATSQVNSFSLVGSATNLEPVFSVIGSDTNISMGFQSKGTGAIDLAAGSSGVNISNGGTVTAITRTNAGAGYTSFPSVAISAPTTAGGVQATASVANMLAGNTSTIAGGGTGYTLNDTITVVGGTPTSVAATYTVTGVSGGVITSVTALNFAAYTVLPTNPVSVTGGTGTGATLNLVYSIGSSFTITNAGSGYIEQPTVTFSGGGGSGASAYATVGSPIVVRSLGSVMSLYTNNGEGFRVQDSGTTSTSYWTAFGSSTTPSLRAVSSVSGAINTASAVPIQFQTNTSVEQFRVSHTASAVNYVQVTGSATGSGGTISAQGSDANIPIFIQSKGTGWVEAKSNGKTALVAYNASSSAVNYLQVEGRTSGNAPTLLANGSDTNIDLTLTPKGTGKVVITNGLQGGTF